MEAYIGKIIDYINNLGPDEIKILIAVTAILLFYLVFKKGGILAAFALALVYLIAYVLYINDFFNVYNMNVEVNDRHMQDIQREIEND